jgi:methionine synthase II (cobalamin-independent)
MKFNFEATGIGSVPFADARGAVKLICDNFRDIPFWPQLPKRSYLENMYVQFSERLPGIVTDEANKGIYVDTTGVAETIEEVYEKYTSDDIDFFSISKTHAAGLYEFLEYLETLPVKPKFVKGQTTGPISYALCLTDQNKRAVIHDKDLFEILTKTLSMRARWQVRKLKKFAPHVIIFIDEPYLVSIGSSFVSINIENAFGKLDELVKAVKSEGALAGIHCCGNTDWPLLLKRDIDVLSFDAYNYSKEFSLYTDDIRNFMSRGASVAWGVVPSSDEIKARTKKALAENLKASIGLLRDKGIEMPVSSLITPSCGVGTLTEDDARAVLEMTSKLSRIFQ